MTTTDKHGNDNRRDGFSAPGLRPADAARPVSRLAAGPFSVAQDKRNRDAASLSGALMTGLLVVYPAFATVAAIVIGLFLSTPAGGV